jgi:hypothetical protein
MKQGQTGPSDARTAHLPSPSRVVLRIFMDMIGRPVESRRTTAPAERVSVTRVVRSLVRGECRMRESVDERSDEAGAARDPRAGLDGCQRILILGRTGSGKTTLARELAAATGLPHVELDALYFEPGFTTVPLPVLRERTAIAVAQTRWVTDGNKAAVRDLVWPRADTVVWLDYPLAVSLWRLAKRARRRTRSLRTEAARPGSGLRLGQQMRSGAKGVFTALRSHRGQRREYPRMFAEPGNSHLAVVRLRSPRATRRWVERVLADYRPE